MTTTLPPSVLTRSRRHCSVSHSLSPALLSIKMGGDARCFTPSPSSIFARGSAAAVDTPAYSVNTSSPTPGQAPKDPIRQLIFRTSHLPSLIW
ncbi:hypothetical protein A4X13_0g8166 [Tilletia indica]|uniref:Uncharacterized protein n=1 Tax=Tilletia indica TaxID=43049 RepID=A0A8T8SFY3_9BASI|nr:hypothetical protein A4X13_0g8166 [Tilletia indica]